MWTEEDEAEFRQRGTKVYRLQGAGTDDRPLNDKRLEHNDAFITWEPAGVTIVSDSGHRRRTGATYALWVYEPPQVYPDPPPPPPAPMDPILAEDEQQEEGLEMLPSPPASPPLAPTRQRAPWGSNKYKNITRIDHPAKRTFGYFVRVRRNGDGRTKFFSDNKHGDRLGSLAAAIEWRDEQYLELGRQGLRKAPPGSALPVGVRRVTTDGYARWVAQWVDAKGKRRTRSFAIVKYGDDRAKKLAVKARLRGEKQRLG
ncbi:AP2 domain-containing protein [Candidatus Gracilibacteria bacterium]|nr:AP2 domain-containing protein [Candidatus Gracilibacteria bacterium]